LAGTAAVTQSLLGPHELTGLVRVAVHFLIAFHLHALYPAWLLTGSPADTRLDPVPDLHTVATATVVTQTKLALFTVAGPHGHQLIHTLILRLLLDRDDFTFDLFVSLTRHGWSGQQKRKNRNRND